LSVNPGEAAGDLARIAKIGQDESLDLIIVTTGLASSEHEILNMGSKLALNLAPPLPRGNLRRVDNVLD
jgi:hypothetical protein